MTNLDKFHEWVESQSPLALREYIHAQAAWQARGELDAVRIKEWQSLSDEEIEEAVNYLNVKIDYPIMFARLIEMRLKEKNNG